MPPPPDGDETKVASHTLAYLRSLDRKLDVVVDTMQRHGERLARVERDLGEMRLELGRDLAEIRRDLVEVKGDIVLLENKMVTAQTEILMILHRLDTGADGTKSEE